MSSQAASFDGRGARGRSTGMGLWGPHAGASISRRRPEAPGAWPTALRPAPIKVLILVRGWPPRLQSPPCTLPSSSAWIAGLSFLSANLGALELMGWAAAAYEYGILATHWYWIGAIPAMVFLGL